MCGYTRNTTAWGLAMRATIRASVVTGVAIAGISALVAAPSAPPPETQSPRTVVSEVQLTAAPALGAIPLAFIRNQFQYCSLICPYAVQGAITVPVAAVQAPGTFVGSLATSGSLFKAIGAAAASVTGPANDAVTPLINNDVFLVVPKAFHALDVAVVEAFNVGAALLSPGQLVAAIENARTNILAALNQPVGSPTTPTGARNIFQVVAVSAIDVFTAVAFQAGELLLAGVVQTVDAVAQELAQSGDPVAALAAGAAQAGTVINQSSGIVTSAVDTAATNIRNSLNDPFPSAPAPAATSSVAAISEEQAEPETDPAAEKRSEKGDSDTAETADAPGTTDEQGQSEADKQSADKPDVEADKQSEDKPKADSKDAPQAEKDEPKSEPKAEPKAEPNADKDDDSARASD